MQAWRASSAIRVMSSARVQRVGDGAVQPQSTCRRERVVADLSEEGVGEREVRRDGPAARRRDRRLRSARAPRGNPRAGASPRWRAGRRRTRCRSPRRCRGAPGRRRRGGRSGESGSPVTDVSMAWLSLVASSRANSGLPSVSAWMRSGSPVRSSPPTRTATSGRDRPRRLIVVTAGRRARSARRRATGSVRSGACPSS